MLRVVLPGVVIDEQRAQRAQARASLGVPEHAPCVLLVGNDLGRKGLPALLQALQELPPEVMVLAVGHASRIPTFRAMADQMGLTQRVVFHAEMQDIRLAYCCADILAHPTLADTFAMVVLEAMACAVPVVVSGPAYCGIAQLLTEGENALLLDDPQDAKALATALRRLLTDAPLHAKLAQAGVEFAKLHEWQCKAAEQEAIYLELAANERIA
jgi:UDP-glucose:(heptosyl)LPS alpha-1,3-glucosyltransferase